MQAAVFPFGGFWIRVIASLTDGVILGVLVFVADRVAYGSSAEGIWQLIVYLGSFAYMVACTPIWGATPGRLAAGYHIVGADGRHISFWRSLGREASKAISALALLLGYIWVGFDPKKQGWHDRIARTFVVRKDFVQS